jgi:hypothetical protein
MVQEKSSIGRRQFLRQTSVCVTAGFGCLAGMPSEGKAGQTIDPRTMRELTEADFRQSIGQSFHVTVEFNHRTPMAAELILKATAGESPAASGRATRPPHVRQNPFSLTFADRDSEQLQQGTYLVKHALFGCFPLFLVPQGVDGGQRVRHYIAVFG